MAVRLLVKAESATYREIWKLKLWYHYVVA